MYILKLGDKEKGGIELYLKLKKRFTQHLQGDITDAGFRYESFAHKFDRIECVEVGQLPEEEMYNQTAAQLRPFKE